METVKKISPKTIIGKIPAIPVGDKKPLYRVFGVANDIRIGESSFGPWTSFLGEFRAINMETGEMVASPQCFLPEPASGMIAAQLRQTDDEGKRVVQSIDFAFEVGIKGIEFAGHDTYEYTARSLIEPKQSDKLAALTVAASEGLPRLSHEAGEVEDKPKKGSKSGK